METNKMNKNITSAWGRGSGASLDFFPRFVSLVADFWGLGMASYPVNPFSKS